MHKPGHDSMRSGSLPFKFYMVALLLAIAMPLVGGLAWVTYRDFEESRRDAETVVLRSAQLSAERTASFLRESEDILRGLSQYPQLRALDRRQCGALLKVVNGLLKYHANVITRDAAGNLVCTAVAPKAGGRPVAASPQYIEEVLRTGKFVLDKPVRSSITGEWVLALGYPLRDAQDRIVGVVALSLDLAKFHEIASGVVLVNGTATQIITGDGIVIASSQDGWTAVGQDASHTDIVRKVPIATDGTVRAHDAAGTGRIYGFTTVPGTDWRAYAGIPAEVVFAKSRHDLWQNILIIVGIVALAALLSVFLARKVVKPVGNIAGAAMAVAAGDRAARADPSGPAEVKLVAAQFNNMLDVLDKAEQRLSGIITSATDAIITINEDHEITLANPAVEIMFGYNEVDLLGKPISTLIPERYHGVHAEHIGNFARTSVANRAMGRFGEVTGRRADGHEFPVDASISQMKLGGQRLFTVIMRDVTRRIEAEKALRKNYELLDRIFETTHFCVVYLDSNFNFVRVNRAYAGACGHPTGYFVGKNHFDLYPNEEVEARFRQVVASGRPFTTYANPFEFPEHPEWGVTYWDWTLHPLRNADGAVEGLLFALLDVTERTRVALELERTTAIAQLLESLARVANEATTPEEAMRISLTRLCDHGNWTLGRVAMTHALGGDLALSASSVWHATDLARHEEFIRISQNLRPFPMTGPFMGGVMREQRPVWIADMKEAHAFHRRAAALAGGLHAAFAFPVTVQGKVVAFLEFFADAPRAVDSGLVEASEAIAAQLARSIERSRAAEANAQLAAIIENSGDAVISCDTDRRILTWNAAAERLFGYAAAEVIGRDVFLLIPAEQQAEATRKLALLKEGVALPTYDAVRLGKDGRRVDVSGTLSPIKDGGGTLKGISFALRDISERKRAEAEHAQLAAIVESSNDAILMRGLDRTILSWNAAAERLFGWSAQEAVGQSIDLIAPPERRGKRLGLTERLAVSEYLNSIESTHLRKDGVRILTQLTVSPVRDRSGNIIAHSFLVRDVSELKRNQEALQRYATRLRELSRRLQEVEEAERRAISRELHDRIGQDLSTLTLMFGRLAARLPKESLSAAGKQLQDIQGLLRGTVENVRDVMAELRPLVLDDYGLFAALRHHVTEFGKRTGISVALTGTDLHPRLPSLVETAMFRISQEAFNNIAKHAQARKIDVSLKVVSERVVLDIADDGIGFDARVTRLPGQHLGMTIMRERADAAGILLRLDSAPRAGTRITLEVERAAT